MRAGARGGGCLAWLIAAPLAALAGSAAADVDLTSSVTVEATLTDNDEFEPDGKSDALISVRPRISLRQVGGRSRTGLDYSINTQYSARDSDVELIHSLAGFNNMEYIKDFFFVDTSAAISQEVIDNERGAPVRRGDRADNLSTVQRYSVSPYIINRLGSFATSEVRARASYVNSSSFVLDDATFYSLTGTLRSGLDFTSFLWTARAEYEKENEDDGDRTTKNVRFDTVTVIDPTFSLLGGIGYEKIEDDSLANDIDGIIWDVGFDWRPGPKLSIVARYGDRFEEDNFFLNANYRITPRTSLFARFEQTLTTEQALFLRDLQFIGIDEDGNLIDTRTGLPISEDEDLFGLSDETFRQNVFSAGISTTRERDSLSLRGSYETREFESASDDETIYGVDANWTHRLTRSMTSNISLGYDNIDFGSDAPGRVDDLYTFQASLTEQFAEDLAGTVRYLFRTRDSNRIGQDATENAVVVSVTKTF